MRQFKKMWWVMLVLVLSNLSPLLAADEEGLAPEQRRKAMRAFVEGMREKMLENDEEAISLFQKSTAIDPNNDAAYFELAELFFNQGETLKAIEMGQKAYELRPSNKNYALQYVDLLRAADKTEEGFQVYRDLIKLYPEDTDLYVEASYFMFTSGDVKNAIKMLDELEKISGQSEGIVQQKKKYLLGGNDVDGAIKELKNYLDHDPDNINVRLDLADIYIQNEDYDKGLEVYRDVLKVDPYNESALIEVSESLVKQGKYDEAFDLRKKLFANASVDIDLKIKVIYNYVRQLQLLEPGSKDYQFLLNEANQLSSVNVQTHSGNAKSHAVRGDLFYVSGNDDSAVVSYEKSLNIRKDIFTVWEQLMLIYSSTQQFKKLDKTADKALELYPNQPIASYFKGVASGQLKKYDAAVTAYKKALKLAEFNEPLKLQLLTNLGDVYHELKQHEKSDSSYLAAIALDTTNAYALNNYSYHLSVRGEKLTEAKRMSKRSNELLPNNPSFLDTYAWILFKLGEFEDAKVWQMKAIDNGGDKQPVVLEHYGDILFKLGETTQALEYWKKAQQNGATSELLPQKIEDQQFYEAQ